MWRPNQYITNIFTNQTIDILNNSTEPSFTYLAYNTPHLPHSAPQWAIDHLRGVLYDFEYISSEASLGKNPFTVHYQIISSVVMKQKSTSEL